MHPILVLFCLVPLSQSFFPKASEQEKYGDDYGVDVTTPIHHYLDPKSYYGERYTSIMAGCYTKYSRRECDATEKQRINMNMDQPKSQVNYTEIGFKKMLAPEEVWKQLIKFYDQNVEKRHIENWPRGNTYTNHWDAATEFIDVGDGSLGGGNWLKQTIWNGVKPILEEWTGQELTATSLYGIRLYRNDAVLATHVDRLPLVSSAIIQVTQDIDEPWPIEVYTHDGKAVNVTMAPGEMVLYESHTVLHGRPFPLKGNLYANLFVHFAPVNHDTNNAEMRKAGKNLRTKHRVLPAEKPDHVTDPLVKFGGPDKSDRDKEMLDLHRKRKASKGQKQPLPSGAPEGVKESFQKLFTAGKQFVGKMAGLTKHYKSNIEEEDRTTGRTPLHFAASRGELSNVKAILDGKPHDQVKMLLHATDSNGWQPLHEATRSGHEEVVQYLVNLGADLSTVTIHGGTALWWAKRSLDAAHPIIHYLESKGAPEEGETM